jgi:hypothetical protein
VRERGIVEENLSVEKKKRKEKSNSPSAEEEEEDRVSLPISSARELDVFSFFCLEGSFSSKSAGNVRSSHGTRIQFENALVFALTTIEEDDRYLLLSIRGFLDDGIVEKKRGDDHD